MIVKVNKSVFESNVKKINDSITDFKGFIDDMNKTVDDISLIWKGEEYNNFSSKMNDFAKELNNYVEQLETYQSFLAGYIEAHKAIDSTFENKNIELK